MIFRFVVETIRNTSPLSATGGWVKTPYIASKLGLAECTVRTYLYDLEAAGAIERKPDLFHGRWRPR